MDLGHPGREEVLPEAFPDDNVDMTSTNRSQQRYDHRLRDFVRSSSNIKRATQLGVPRSTAHGWLTSSQVEIVTVDVFDMDILSLQKEVFALRQRIKTDRCIVSAGTAISDDLMSVLWEKLGGYG